MNYINTNDTGAQWGSSLLKDLAFIKQRLRYPFSKKTLPGTLLTGVFLFFALRMFSVMLFVNSKAFPMLKWLIIPLILLILFGGFYRYYRTLKFISIPTPFFANENMKLVEVFLQSQHLALYRHPEAPEIFQILSRPLGNARNEQREVMIFIADDKRVLVNSHFVNQKYSITPPSGNAGKMANRLREWIKMYYPAASTSLTI